MTPRARWALLGLALSVSAASALAYAQLALFPNASSPRSTAVADRIGVVDPRFSDCTGCHREAASAHAGSMHAQAFDDALFQREWSHDRGAWCVGCHAPLAQDARDPRAHEGVGCAACHLRDGEVLATRVGGRAPHASRIEPRLASNETCGACHEFDFPHRRGEPMQRTLSEWTQRGSSDRCVDCHDAHAAPGARDDAMWSHALEIDVHAEQQGDEVHVRVRLDGHAAHAIPTGDLYRRLVFRAWPEGDELRAAEVELARVFDVDADGATVEAADQRVLPGEPRRIEVTLAASDVVRWTLDWHALPAGAREVDAIDPVQRSHRVAEGSARVDDVSESCGAPRRACRRP